MRVAAKFLVGNVIRGPFKDDYRKIRARRWNGEFWEYAFERPVTVATTWYPERSLKPLTAFEACR
jgi:hypothetical protein